MTEKKEFDESGSKSFYNAVEAALAIEKHKTTGEGFKTYLKKFLQSELKQKQSKERRQDIKRALNLLKTTKIELSKTKIESPDKKTEETIHIITQTPKETGKQGELFPNPISEMYFGIARSIADKTNIIIKDITPEKAAESFKYKGPEIYSVCKNGKTAIIKFKTGSITDEDQFTEKLLKLKDAKTIKTFAGLWAYAKQQGSFTFKGVRISDILKIMNLKKPKAGYTQKQKQDITEIIHYLRDIEIFLDHDIKTKNEKGTIVKETERKYFNIFRLYESTHSKKTKEVKNSKGDIIYKKGDTDDRIIIKFWGEFLPGYNIGRHPGRLFPKKFLLLDANKDREAISLGYWFLIRLGQLRQGVECEGGPVNELFFKTDRGELISRGGYKKTDDTKKSIASNYLINALNKLIEKDIISRFEPETISTDDNQKIKIFASNKGYLPEKAEKTNEA